MSLENSEFRTLQLSMGTLRDLAAQSIHTFTAIPDSQEITSLEFGDITTDTEGRELVTVRYGVEKRKRLNPQDNEVET